MCFFTSEFEVLTHFDAVFVIADSVQFIEQRRILLDRCRNACLQIPVRRIHMLPIVDIRIEIQVWVLQFESFSKIVNCTNAVSVLVDGIYRTILILFGSHIASTIMFKGLKL